MLSVTIAVSVVCILFVLWIIAIGYTIKNMVDGGFDDDDCYFETDEEDDEEDCY
jgi:hypothetical protein